MVKFFAITHYYGNDHSGYCSDPEDETIDEYKIEVVTMNLRCNQPIPNKKQLSKINEGCSRGGSRWCEQFKQYNQTTDCIGVYPLDYKSTFNSQSVFNLLNEILIGFPREIISLIYDYNSEKCKISQLLHGLLDWNKILGDPNHPLYIDNAEKKKNVLEGSGKVELAVFNTERKTLETDNYPFAFNKDMSHVVIGYHYLKTTEKCGEMNDNDELDEVEIANLNLVKNLIY